MHWVRRVWKKCPVSMVHIGIGYLRSRSRRWVRVWIFRDFCTHYSDTGLLTQQCWEVLEPETLWELHQFTNWDRRISWTSRIRFSWYLGFGVGLVWSILRLRPVSKSAYYWLCSTGLHNCGYTNLKYISGPRTGLRMQNQQIAMGNAKNSLIGLFMLWWGFLAFNSGR